jgi:signal transduction histidine kinase
MLQELIDFAQGEDIKLSLEQHNLNDFVNELISLIQAIIGPRPIRVEKDLQYRGDAVFDARKLRRVLHNLLVNAVEASAAHGGTVRIHVHTEGTTLVFSVFDSGPGIPAAIAAHLFEPFVTYGKAGGTGLGLAICKNIVEAHHGTIAIDHVPKVGTTVFVKLPECLAAASR